MLLDMRTNGQRKTTENTLMYQVVYAIWRVIHFVVSRASDENVARLLRLSATELSPIQTCPTNCSSRSPAHPVRTLVDTSTYVP